MKILFLILSILCYSFSSEKFKETRYIEVLDLEQYKYGEMSFVNDKLTISYKKPKQETITYFKDRLEISYKNELKIYSFKKYPKLQYMGVLFKAILNKNYDSLDDFFDIKKEKNRIILNSKSAISNIINSVEINTISKNNEIIMNMSNQDKITIETIN